MKDHIQGNIFICMHCYEVYFAYYTCDTRTCSNCKHYKLVNNNWTTTSMCTWLNKEIRSHDSVCKHIDQEKPVLPESARCFFCSYYSTEIMKDSSVEGGEIKVGVCKYTGKDGWKFKQGDVVPCSDYTPSFEKYKRYRKEWDNLGMLFDDSIHIPEFDKMIAEESAVDILNNKNNTQGENKK